MLEKREHYARTRTGRVMEFVSLHPRSGGAGAVDTLQLFEVLAVDFGIRAEEVEVCAQRLPFARRLQLLLRPLVALALVNVKDVDLHVLGPAREIRENGRPLAQVTDHAAADVAGEDRARERVLEQDPNHLF